MAVSISSSARSYWSGSRFSDFRPNSACRNAATSFPRCAMRASLRWPSASRLSACFSSPAARCRQQRPQLRNFLKKISRIRHDGSLSGTRRLVWPENAWRRNKSRYSTVSGAHAVTARTRRQSRPENSASNYACDSAIIPSVTAGQAKPCSSSRLHAITSPVPSQRRQCRRTLRLGAPEVC